MRPIKQSVLSGSMILAGLWIGWGGLVLPCGLHAAAIEWNAGVATGDAVVSDRGILLEAANFGDAGTTSPVVNGVSFTAIDFTAGQSPVRLVGLTYNTGEHGKLPGPGINELFDTIAYRSGVDPQTAVLTGLEVGREYEVQFFYYHDHVNRSVEIGDSEGQAIRLSETGDPLYASGTFTADGPEQILTFDASTGSQFLNAFQLRATPFNPPVVLDQVVISEFMASNDSHVTDGDGNHPDWIEIWNSTGAAVDLNGWYLTDDLSDLTKWPFPPLVLPVDAYQVVFASGQAAPGYVDVGGFHHTNFTFDKEGGGAVALVRPAGSGLLKIAWSYTDYPRQATDLAYGLYGTDIPLTVGYPSAPTPGRRNVGQGFLGLLDDVRCFPRRGFYTTPFQVQVGCPTEGVRIRYTTDGSVPTLEHGLENPGGQGIPVTGTTVLRATAFKDGFRPSRVETHTYLFLRDVVEQSSRPGGFPLTWTGVDYGMEHDPTDLARIAGDPDLEVAEARAVIAGALEALPTLALTMPVEDWFGVERGIYHHTAGEGRAWERQVSAEWIWPGSEPVDGFQIDCGVRIQGFTSRDPVRNPKHSLRLVFRGDYGATKMRYPLFGEEGPAEFDTIVLRSNSQDAWVYNTANNRLGQFVRDEWNRQVMAQLGQNNPRGAWVHLYLNGLYWGVYNPTERPDASFNAAHFGGDADNYDAIKNHEEVLDGTDEAYRELLGLIQVDPGDFSVGYRDLSTPLDYVGVASVIEIENLADYILHNVYSAAEDWPGNYYMAYDRSGTHGGWRFFDWDNEHGLKGSVTEDRTQAHWREADSPTKFHHALRSNAEYRLLFADRLQRAFFNGGPLYVDPEHPAWDPEYPDHNRPAALWMELTRGLETALIAESARWGDYRRTPPYTVHGDFTSLRAELLENWFPQRSAIVMNDFQAAGLYPVTAAPVFSRWGGEVPPGFRLMITAPSGGTVYYTFDGSDPRTRHTGAVAPDALVYADGLTVAKSARIRARVLRGAEWSALTEALFLVGTPASADNLIVSEFLYHPVTPDETEFIELMNVSDRDTVDLGGVRFSAGIAFTFPPGILLAPGERLTLVANPQAFDARYGAGVRRLGSYSGKLDNAGEAIVVIDATGTDIERFTYDDAFPWPQSADGDGYSVVRSGPEHRPPARDPLSWRPSAAVGGSPGGTDATQFAGDPLADVDGDGRPALLEHALGSSDHLPDSAHCLRVATGSFSSSAGEPMRFLTAAITRNLAADDIELIIEGSTDLQRWDRIIAAPELASRTHHGEGRATLVYRCGRGISTTSALFLRLSVSQRALLNSLGP